MKNQILNIGKALNKAQQKQIHGGFPSTELSNEDTVRCRCNGFDLGVSSSANACAAACLRCVSAGPCAV